MSAATRPEDVPAIIDICKLKARYFRYIDGKNWAGMAEVFTPDATLFFPENQGEPANFAEAVALMAKALEGGVSIHHGHMPEIEILSADTARGVWAMEDRIHWPSNRTSMLGLEYLHGYGHYHEEYVRVEGRWMIRTMKITRLWVQNIAPARAVS